MDGHRGLTVAEVCKVTGAEPPTVRSWINRRRLARNRHGRIDLADLVRYLDKRGTIGQHKA